MSRRAAAVAASVLLLLLAPAARADEVVREADDYYQLTVPRGWSAIEPAAGAEDIVLARAHAATGQALAVTRVAYPNRHRKDKAYRDQVVAGLAAATRDYKQLSRRDRTLSTVPVTDVVFRHRAASGVRVTSVRFLFFRTFTLILTVAGPAEGHDRAKRATAALLSSFQPYYARD